METEQAAEGKMMSNDSLNDSRLAFQKWCIKTNMASEFTFRGEDFRDDATQYLWEAWQAGVSHKHHATPDRDGLIEAISMYMGWEESAVKMVDECILPFLQRREISYIQTEPPLTNSVLEYSVTGLPEGDARKGAVGRVVTPTDDGSAPTPSPAACSEFIGLYQDSALTSDQPVEMSQSPLKVQSQEMNLLEWLKKNRPEVFEEQKHLDAGSPEQAYWHYGRWSALKDVREHERESSTLSEEDHVEVVKAMAAHMEKTAAFIMTPEALASQGWIVHVAATPHGCCASILSEGKPYRIYRCQNAGSTAEAFSACLQQMNQPTDGEG